MKIEQIVKFIKDNYPEAYINDGGKPFIFFYEHEFYEMLLNFQKEIKGGGK